MRPNAAYLALMVAGVPLAGLGLGMAGVSRWLVIAAGAVLVVVFGVPVLISTVFRVPVLVVDDAGIRLPLMGVRLAWAEVAAVRQTSGPTRPALLIIAVDNRVALSRMRPWLRSEGRTNIARYGTPIVVPEHSMDHTLEQMQSAITGRLVSPPDTR